MPSNVAKECERVLKAAPHFQIPGLGERESVQAICRVVERLGRDQADGWGDGYLSATNGRVNPDAIADAVRLVRVTRFPGLGREVVGGLRHVVSVDNGAAYWELWHRGGNWYAVTGADRDKLLKGEGDSEGVEIALIPGVMKGMSGVEAVDRLLKMVDEASSSGVRVKRKKGH